MVPLDSLVSFLLVLMLLSLLTVRFCHLFVETVSSGLHLIIGHRSIEVAQLLLMLVDRFRMRLYSLAVLLNKLLQES